MNRHEYYKYQAWVAGIILTIVLALNRLEILDVQTSTIIAIPVIIYLVITAFMSFKHLKNKGDIESEKDVELAKMRVAAEIKKVEAKYAAKVAKAQAKAKKKEDKN